MYLTNFENMLLKIYCIIFILFIDLDIIVYVIRNAWQSLAYNPLGTAVLPQQVVANITVLPPGKHAKNAHSISPPSLLSRFIQHYLVAMATSIDKSCMLNQPKERTSDTQMWGALYHVLYNMSNSLCQGLFAVEP